MKTNHIATGVALIVLTILLGVSVSAQTAGITSDPTTVIPVESQNYLLELFLKLAITHSWLATVFAVMGTLRAAAKPLSTFVHFFVNLTPSPVDNGVLDSLMKFFTETTTGKFLAYLIDWLTSIKIVPPK